MLYLVLCTRSNRPLYACCIPELLPFGTSAILHLFYSAPLLIGILVFFLWLTSSIWHFQCVLFRQIFKPEPLLFGTIGDKPYISQHCGSIILFYGFISRCVI